MLPNKKLKNIFRISGEKNEVEDYEVISEYHGDRTESDVSYASSPEVIPRASISLVRTEKSRTINISAVHAQQKSLNAQLVIKIDDKFKNPMGLGVTPNLIIIANSCENSVVAYDHKGNFKTYIRTEEAFKMPTVILVLDSGMVYIKDDTQVHVFDRELQYIKVFGKEIIRRMPVGLMCIEGTFWKFRFFLP